MSGSHHARVGAYRRLLAVATAGVLALIVVLALVPAASARPRAHTASYIVAWRHAGAKIVQHGGRYYALWQCDVGGTVIAAGAWWIWMTPGMTAVGMLGGGAFTIGCHIGAPDGPAYYQDGVPYVMSPCWVVYPHGNYRRRFEECMA